ncbi:MAG: hypothetical protein NT053_15340 [Cyanobacteria bacterium]|nr:hypothetical protein [Cyanobacteriota bacterium]
MKETFSPEGGSLGRRDCRQVVLLPRLRAALERLNPGQLPEAISAAIEEISRNRSAMGLVAVFAHIEQAYPERDRSVYSLAGLSSPAQQPEHQGQAG